MFLAWIDSFLEAIFSSTHYAFYGGGLPFRPSFPIIDGCQVYPVYTQRQQNVYRGAENKSFSKKQTKLVGCFLVLAVIKNGVFWNIKIMFFFFC